MGEGRGKGGGEKGKRQRKGYTFIFRKPLSLQVKESCGLLTPLLTTVCPSMWLPTVHKVVGRGKGRDMVVSQLQKYDSGQEKEEMLLSSETLCCMLMESCAVPTPLQGHSSPALSPTYPRSSVLRDLLTARPCAMVTAPSSPIPHPAARRWCSEPDRASSCEVHSTGEKRRRGELPGPAHPLFLTLGTAGTRFISALSTRNMHVSCMSQEISCVLHHVCFMHVTHTVCMHVSCSMHGTFEKLQQ